jgi:hypothetical protein
MIDLPSQNVRYLFLVVIQIQSGFNVCSINLYDENKLKLMLFPNGLVCWMIEGGAFKFNKSHSHIDKWMVT